LNRRDWLLIAITLAGDRGLTPIQIQKAMFLLRMEAPDLIGDRFYAFVPYNYGPFSSAIYGDVDVLAAQGLLRDEQAGSNLSKYVATQAGLDRVGALREDINPGAREYLTAVVRWILSVDFTQLLRSIYAKYPDYAVNSVFRR
jgi:hypothetical protein